MPKKKTAPKKATRRVRTTVTKSSQKSWLQSYIEQREHFFATHPNARLLLAIFIIAVAIYVAMLIRVNYVTEVSAMMAAEGLPYEAKVIPLLGW